VDQTRTFAVVLEPEVGGGFTVRVPSLPEIVTYGKDGREAPIRALERAGFVVSPTSGSHCRLIPRPHSQSYYSHA